MLDRIRYTCQENPCIDGWMGKTHDHQHCSQCMIYPHTTFMVIRYTTVTLPSIYSCCIYLAVGIIIFFRRRIYPAGMAVKGLMLMTHVQETCTRNFNNTEIDLMLNIAMYVMFLRHSVGNSILIALNRLVT